MLYVDTSALVSTLLSETRSELVRLALTERAGNLAISPWTLTEAQSAICLRLRVGAISRDTAIEAEANLQREAAESYSVIEIIRDDFTEAAAMMRCDGPALRAADALHLAIARRCGALLLTLDREMAVAAEFHAVSLIEV